MPINPDDYTEGLGIEDLNQGEGTFTSVYGGATKNKINLKSLLYDANQTLEAVISGLVDANTIETYKTQIKNVGNNIAILTSLNNNLASYTNAFGIASDITTLNSNSGVLQKVSDNIPTIDAVGTDLLLVTSKIEAVFAELTGTIATVAGDTTAINTINSALSDINLLAVSANITAMSTLSSKVAEIGRLGTSAQSAVMTRLDAQITKMNSLDQSLTKVTTVEAALTTINNVYNNLANINNVVAASVDLGNTNFAWSGTSLIVTQPDGTIEAAVNLKGADSTVPGPAGADSTVPGPIGPAGAASNASYVLSGSTLVITL